MSRRTWQVDFSEKKLSVCCSPTQMTHLFLLSLSLLLVFAPSTYAHIDVTDYFSGSKAAPRLHIDKPENGEVLEGTSLLSFLLIRLSIVYPLSSQFDNSIRSTSLNHAPLHPIHHRSAPSREVKYQGLHLSKSIP